MRSKNVTHLKHFHRLNNCIDDAGLIKEGKDADFKEVVSLISNAGWVLEEIIFNLVDVGMSEDIADQIGNKYFYL